MGIVNIRQLQQSIIVKIMADHLKKSCKLLIYSFKLSIIKQWQQKQIIQIDILKINKKRKLYSTIDKKNNEKSHQATVRKIRENNNTVFHSIH